MWYAAQTSMQVKPGKTVRVGDSYKVVDNSNRSAFVLIGASVVENGLAKPIDTRAHEACRHYKAAAITNLISHYKLNE